MVVLMPGANLANDERIREDMRLNLMSVEPKGSVAATRYTAGPHPTTPEFRTPFGYWAILIHIRPETLFCAQLVLGSNYQWVAVLLPSLIMLLAKFAGYRFTIAAIYSAGRLDVTLKRGMDD